MKFREMTYTRPDIDALLARCKELAAKAESAASSEALVAVYYEQSRAFADYNTAANLASIHYTCDTRDAAWKAEQDFFDANGPAVQNASVEISRAFLANPHVDALTEAFGTTCVAGMKNAVLGMDERTLDLQKEYNALVSQYQQIYGGALVELDGKQLTIPQLGPYKESLDAKTRRAAYEAEAGYFDAHRAELDELYTKIVKNLNAQAKLMGYHDYSELSYVRMNRIGYGPEEIQRFRDQVAHDVVPELQKVIALKAKRTGIEHPTFCDLPVSFKDGNPKPIEGYDARMAAARTMYHELSPETAEFIDFMMDGELLDVLSRTGKAGGGYCTSIGDYKVPFIFANFNGTSGDVDVITHECGHAFQGYLLRDEEIREFADITMETAEIHSMSMEYFTYNWMELFFGDRKDDYLKMHLEDSAAFVPYGCMVDEFQHIVYEKPEMTPAERKAVWAGLEKVYRPHMDYEEDPFFGQGGFWQKQPHIFGSPFYYIDYCLASVCAMQFKVMMDEDFEKAWKNYYKLCNLSARDFFTNVIVEAGLNSPFEDGCMEKLVDKFEKKAFNR